jgi:hypothetical protein
MKSIVFMPSIMPHCGGGSGDIAGFLTMLLTLLIVGVILYVFGIFANILHIKISNGFAYTPICWHDIKPGELSNPVLGWIGGIFGFAFIGVAVIMGLVAGVYWIIISL